MGSKWKSIVLNDLINQGHAFLQTGPFGTALKAEEYSDNGVPLISVREIRNGYIKIEGTTPRVSRHTTSRLPKFVLNKGDIVFARKGGVDRTAYITEKEAGWFLGSDGIYLRLDDNYNSLFISYIMRSPTTREWLIKNSEGTTMPSLNQKILSRIPLTIPDLYKQKIIANFLYSLDKKININNQLNHTLEQMSQTLFKSWFVDFDPVIDNALDAGNPIPEAMQSRVELRQKVRNSADFKPLPAEIRSLFPSEFEETELGWGPKGWEIGKLQDLLILQRGFDLPSTQRNIGLHPIIAASGYNGTHDIAMVKAPGIVTGRSGVLGNVFLILEDFWPLNTTLWVKELKHATPCYGYELLKMIDFSSFNGGSAVPTLNRNHIHNLDYLLPPRNLIEKFELFSMSLYRQVHEFKKQAQTLTALRDTLLPKLISGELSLEDLPDLSTDTEAA